MALAALGLTFSLVPLGSHFAGHADAGAPAAGPAAAHGAPAPEKGRALFDGASCGACHMLADAGAAGEVGPPLDHNPNLTTDFVTNRVAHGQGGMPAFSDQLSEQEIADLAAYILRVSAK